MAITLAIFLCSFNRANAQTFNFFVSNDHLISSTVFEFDVSIANTSGADFKLRTVQHCYSFNPAFINGATIAANYVTGPPSTQMINYSPGSITYSAAANGFQVAANTGVTCADGTIIPASGNPVRVATFRLTATAGSFGCAPSNPNIVMTGDVPAPAGLALRMAVTKWNDNTCAGGTNSTITGPASQYTRFATLTQYGQVNNNPSPTPIISGSTSFCAGSSTTLDAGTWGGYNWSTGATTQTISVNTAGTFTVTATIGSGCTGSASATTTVNPTPDVDQPANQIVCDGASTTAVNFSGSLPGTIFNWTNDNPSIGLAASGTGNIASFIATNTSSVPVVASLTVTASTGGSFAYIPNSNSSNVSVINTANNTVVATVAVGVGPFGVSVSPDGSKVYVCNTGTWDVSVINTATNTVVATVPVGVAPAGVSVSPDGSKVYVTSLGDNNVSVINTATNTVVATVGVGLGPWGISVSPNGSKVYVANNASTTVSVINTATNTIVATVGVGTQPIGVSVSPDGSKVYVTNINSSDVSVINTSTNTVLATVGVGTRPVGVSVSPDGSKVYVANSTSNNVSVINTASNTVVATVGVGAGPWGVSVSPDGSKVYVANNASDNVSVINTATNTVVATVPVGDGPIALGNFFTAGTACTSTPKTFTITVNPTPNVVATPSAQQICSGAAIETIALTGNVSGTVYNWTRDNIATVTGISASGAGDISGSLTNTTNAPVTVTFTITPTADNCPGSPITATVLVNPNPTPTISGNTSFCAGSSTTLTAILAVGNVSGYSWSTGETTQTISVNTAGTYTVTVTVVNGATGSTGSTGSGSTGSTATNVCTGSTSVTITVNPLPVPSINGATSFCDGSSTTLDAGSFSGYIWSTGATTQTISVNTAGTFTVTVTDVNGCTGSASATVNARNADDNDECTVDGCDPFTGVYHNPVTTDDNNVCTIDGCDPLTGVFHNPVNLTPVITGNLFFCPGSSTTLDAGVFTSYNWSTGAATQTISVNTAGSYTVTVSNPDGCSGTASVTVGISSGLNLNPPGPISGQTLVCRGQRGLVYCVEPVLGATSYVWTLPNGATGISNSPCITLCFNSHFSTGQLCIASVSSCGTSPQSCLTITRVTVAPSTPANISGPSSLCPNTCATYSVTQSANASSYIWAVTGGAYINSGQGTNTVEICAPAGYTGGIISVKASNCKGTSGKKSKNITSLPSTPGLIFGLKSVCRTQTNVQYTVPAVQGAQSYSWTITNGAQITSGANTNSIRVKYTNTTISPVILTVVANAPCGQSAPSMITINVKMNCKTSNDSDSEIEQSPVTHSLNAYPNPTTGKTTITFDSEKDSKYTVKVIDVLGHTLLSEDISALKGYNMNEIDLEDFAAGLYFISVQVDGGQMQTLRLVIN